MLTNEQKFQLTLRKQENWKEEEEKSMIEISWPWFGIVQIVVQLATFQNELFESVWMKR